MRQDTDQTQQREMFKNLRVGHPTEVDKDILLSLHLNRGNFSQQQIDEIMEKATFIFAKRKDMIEHKWHKLKETHSSTNPVARIQTQTTSKGVKYNGRVKCLCKESDIDPILNICRGAKVQITGKNFVPDWGLFNGAVGKVIEIAYEHDTSQLDGSFPKFIIVDIPTYIGPTWIKDQPTWVPIPPIEIDCKKHCCKFFIYPSVSCICKNRKYISRSKHRTKTYYRMYCCSPRKQDDGITMPWITLYVCIKTNYNRFHN
jgi:hypothetical protein